MQETNQINWKNLSREQRGELLFKDNRIKKTKWGWRVTSQTNGCIDYFVRLINYQPKCNCPDCQIAKQKCKHIYAVEFYIKQELTSEGIKETKGIKITYGQQWKAYDMAQTNEKLLFMRLLSDLCLNVEQPKYKFGRPKVPIQDLIFSAVMKVYTTFSLRRFMSDIKIAKEMNLIDYTPCFASIGHFLQREDITVLLKQLIEFSSLPLKTVDTDFVADSSGFSTSRFARYYNFKYGKESTYRVWIKAHLMSGAKTNIVTAVEITEGRVNDCPQLASLIEQTAKNFNIKEVSCDRAYSSRSNLELIKEVGAFPYIPFKSNASTRARRSQIWSKMYHYFMYRHEEFLQHYHKRSNAETVFHMIKTKFKDNLRSKDKTAQINELLCKIICHNICVVIQEINELGVKGEFMIKKE